ncbi:immunity 53 family protein [Adhaeribacter sp. BT258]|uniref:Immunity 53 family protein n=1 Tax=Adhaeribacter terrigena TaxID=2793070 RepID=A0ABS1C6G0_9BACT|nr:immunity 53 family protein [Adhaeribacter terrigena]MBK0404959.1 immunity 53 family protein [Adhaeribacter terrigena]
MENGLIERIQNWYKNNCNGDWEHEFGIKIGTLDNPGWAVTIELNNTSLEEGKIFKQYEKAEDDWLSVKVEDKKFIGYGDPNKLHEILRIFLDEFLISQNNPEFLYEIYIPILNASTPAWQAVDAKLINESIFEIVRIKERQFKNVNVLNIDDFAKLNDKVNSLQTEFKEGDKVICELKLFFDSKELAATEKISTN